MNRKLLIRAVAGAFVLLILLAGAGVGIYFGVRHKPSSGTDAPTASPPSAPGSPLPTSGSGNLFYGINYDPYGLGNDVLCPPAPSTGNQCLSATLIASDMTKLATLTRRVKLYSLTCFDSVSAVLDAAASLGMSVHVGVAVGPSDSENAAELKRLADLVGKYGSTGVISSLVVGNEAVLTEGASVETLAGVVSSARDIVESAGCTAKIGSADIQDIWLGQPTSGAKGADASVGADMTPVVKLIDFIGLNSHPYYYAVDPAVQDGSKFVQKQLTDVSSYWKDKRGYDLPVVITETGFPSAGGQYNGLSPSLKGENAFVTQIETFSRDNKVPVFYFEGMDGDWRRRWAPYADVDYHWGLMTCDRTLKDITLPPPGAL